MERRRLDIRASTCKGGGALWAFLSHVCEMRRGDILELVTDDPLAREDLPEWAACEGWRILEQKVSGEDLTFVLQRPWRHRADRPGQKLTTLAPSSA